MVTFRITQYLEWRKEKMGRQQDAMKMSDDGRVMIPKYIRLRLNLKPKDVFDIVLENNVIKLTPKIDRRQDK